MDKKLYKSASDFDATNWHWPHFSTHELKCKCGKFCDGEYYHHPKFLDALEKLRAKIGMVEINSARRCLNHNAQVGGVKNSMHTSAIAADIKIGNHPRKELYEAAVFAGFTGMGFGVNFLHLDLGPRRRWTYPGGLGLWKRALGYDPLRI